MRAATLVPVALIALIAAVHHTLSEVSRTAACETTYIYEGYEPVELPQHVASLFPQYRLVRYADRDPALQQGIRILKSKTLIPLLFVHGHIGSHQQVRSLASESSRELVRRLQNKDSKWDVWIEWNAVDLASQPSAFEPRILAEQARFTAACLQHLWGSARGGGAGGRILLVGYSMGGLVAEQAMTLLTSHQNSLFGDAVNFEQVVLMVTLGAPQHHLPSFLPPPPSALVPYAPRKKTAAPPDVPRLRVLAGPGDLMVPGLSSWKRWKGRITKTVANEKGNPGSSAAYPTPELTIQVDMDDIPGVWCTSTHKSIVSCNQLVRQLVPLLADVTRAALDGADPKGLADLARQRMTTRFADASAFPKTVEKKVEDAQNTGVKRGARAVLGDAWAHTYRPGPDDRLTVKRVPLGSTTECMIWTADELGMRSDGTLNLAFISLQPVEQFTVAGVLENGGKVDLTLRAAALPGNTSVHGPIGTRRPWNQVLAGIDWMLSATWVLQVPLVMAGGGGGRKFFRAAEVCLLEGSSQVDGQHPRDHRLRASPRNRSTLSSSALIAQIVMDPVPFNSKQNGVANNIKVKLPRHPGAPGVSLNPGHPMILELETPRAVAAFSSVSLSGFIASCALGPAPPWRASLSAGSCSGSSTDNTFVEPVFMAVSDDSEDAGEADTVRSAAVRAVGLSLWHPGVVRRRVLLVADPRCSYTLNVEWDIERWAAYTLQYHASALPAVALSQTIMRLHDGSQETALFVPAFLVSAMSASLSGIDFSSPGNSIFGHRSVQGWMQLLWKLPSYPWLPMSLLDTLVVISVAFLGVQLLSAVLKYSKGALRWAALSAASPFRKTPPPPPAATTTASPATSRAGVRWSFKLGIVVSVVGATLIHPAMPPLLGVGLLFISQMISQDTSSPCAHARANWLLAHVVGSVPAGVWITGNWMSHAPGFPYPLLCWERACALVCGIHASVVALRECGSKANSIGSRPEALLCNTIACIIALCGLVGELYVSVCAWGVLCAINLCTKFCYY